METAAAVGARVGITTTQYLILWITFVGLFILLIYIISKQLRLIRTLGVSSQYHNSSVAPNNIQTEKSFYEVFCEHGFNLLQRDIDNDMTKESILNTLRIFERLGLLISKGGVRRNFVLYLVGDVCVRLWLVLGNYIKQEREKRGDPFWHAGFEYLVMLSLQFHLKKKRGTLIIYHPKDDSLYKSYTTDILAEELKSIEEEMVKMRGGLRVSFKDHLLIRWRRKQLRIRIAT